MADTSLEAIETAPTITSGGCEMYRPYVERYEWHTSTVLAIMRAENRECDPSRNNLTNSEDHKVCVGSYGLLQIGCLHQIPGEDLNSPEHNIAAAYRVYSNRLKWDSDGFNAWSTYLDNSYLEYM